MFYYAIIMLSDAFLSRSLRLEKEIIRPSSIKDEILCLSLDIILDVTRFYQKNYIKGRNENVYSRKKNNKNDTDNA